MGKIERQIRELTSYLEESPRISLAETQQLLNVSESTARRLFTKMEDSGGAIRIHGALQVLPPSKSEYNYPRMEARRLPQKKRIGRAAVDEIGDARTLFLDSGSTVYQFSVCLAEWLRAGRMGQLSVFTNSMKNLQALTGLTDIQFVGGKYRENRQDCCGFLAESALQRLGFDLCILGADGCSVERGVSCTDMETAQLGHIAIEHSQRRVVLVDATKFERDALVSYASMADIHMIITDSELDEETVRTVRATGTNLRVI